MKKIIILLCALLLISAACTSQRGGKASQADVITMNFLTNQPPQQLYEGQSFRVGLNIDNYAAEEKEAFLCIFDELGDYFNGIPANTCQTIKLERTDMSGDSIIPSKKR